MAGPAAAAPRSRIRWALGAQSADAIGGTISIGTFPGSSAAKALAAYREGELSLEVLLMEFRLRRWPQVPDVCSPELEQARTAIDDPEPYVPGSFDDVVLAYDRGWLPDEVYEQLAVAAGGSPPGT